MLEELFELARWAPNHHLTNPWRFRVLGPETLERLKRSAGPEAAGKLDRAPTLVCASVKLGRRPSPGRGGPLRGGVRGLHRAAGGARARARRLLADARCAAHRRGPGGGGHGAGRAVRGAHPSGPRAGREAGRPSACRHPTSYGICRDIPRRGTPGVRDRRVRRRGDRRRHHRRGGGSRRRLARLQRRARGEGRLRLGHLVALVEARARRSSLPPELRSRARARGAAGAPAAGEPRASPRDPAAAADPGVRRASGPTAWPAWG